MENPSREKTTFWHDISNYVIDFILDRSKGGNVIDNKCECRISTHTISEDNKKVDTLNYKNNYNYDGVLTGAGNRQTTYF